MTIQRPGKQIILEVHHLVALVTHSAFQKHFALVKSLDSVMATLQRVVCMAWQD